MDGLRLRLLPGHAGQGVLLLVMTLGLFAVSVHAQDDPGAAPAKTVRQAPGISGDQDQIIPDLGTKATNSSGFDSSRRRGLMRSNRKLSPTDIQNVIAVAEDVSPQWAENLKLMLEQDPDSLGDTIKQKGRRLLGLAMLRERDPALYEVRVGELRCNQELSTVSAAYREAVRDDRTEDVAELKDRLRALVKQSLDFELRARAMELAALDKALRELKSQLQTEIATQDERLEQRLSEVLAVDSPVAGEGSSDTTR